MKTAVLIFLMFYGGLIYSQDSRKEALAIYIDGQEEEGRYFHVGIIPYQVLSRSSGAYFGYDFKRFSVELRPTYTYATDFLTNYWAPYDNFFFQGINGTMAFYFSSSDNNKIGILVNYKNWSYNDKWLPHEQISLWSSYSFKERKSTSIAGLGLGIEFLHDFDLSKMDLAFFANFSVTKFTGRSSVFEGVNKGQSLSYPYTESIKRIHFALAIGFKVGYKKILK